MERPVTLKDGIETTIKAIGQSLINSAGDIARDIHNVRSITIKAVLEPDNIVTFNVNKEYLATITDNKEV